LLNSVSKPIGANRICSTLSPFHYCNELVGDRNICSRAKCSVNHVLQFDASSSFTAMVSENL